MLTRILGPGSTSTLIALLLLLTLEASADTRTSAISGVVRDESGAVVEGVLVTATRVATGVSRSARSGPAGRYRIASLEVGEYQLAAEKDGFRTSVFQDVVLELQREAAIDPVLSLGAVAENIVVTGVARLVEADVATVSDLIGGEAIRNLPLNGRDYIQLATLTAGATPARQQGQNSNMGYGMQLSVAGSRPFQNSFRVDGVTQSTYYGSSPGSVNGVNLGVEAIREFSVLTSSYSAEFGRAAGGVINAVTRSGGNELHGSLFYFHRNDNLDARNFFDREQVPEFRRNQLGGALGGPILKNRTFYFVNYEAFREYRASTSIDTTISNRARQGDLSTGAVAVDPAAAMALAVFPAPNGQDFGDTGLFIYDNPTIGREDFLTTRFDHQLSEYDQLFARYSFDDGRRKDLTAFAAGDRRNASRMHSIAAEETHFFGPGLLNTARFGFHRTLTVAGETTSRIDAADSPSLAFTPSAPVMGILEIAGVTVFPGGSGAPDFDRHAFNSFQLSDQVQRVAGRHTLRLGGRLEWTQFNTDSRATNFGEFLFNSLGRFLTNQPDSFAALLPGADTFRRHRQTIAAWYVQDSWKLSRNLTLDLGLRHEWATVPHEADGKIANLDELMSSAVRVGGPLFENPSLKNFSPRLGLAWRPGPDGLVVRGGYGIFPDLILSQYLVIAGVRNPPFFVRGATSRLAPGSFPGGAFQTVADADQGQLRVDRIDPNPSQPNVQQWNLTVEQDWNNDLSLRLAYIGSRGRHLSSITGDANLATPTTLADGRRFYPADGVKRNPNFSRLRNRTFDATSAYHGFQAQLNRRWRNGLLARVGYTFSKSIDNSSWFFESNESENATTQPVNDDLGYNKGPSSHDQRHSFVASGVWEIPAPFAGWSRALLGGWQLGAIGTYASGSPFSAFVAYDAARTRASRSGVTLGQRPDLAPDANNNPVTKDPARWFDPSAFLRPTPGFLGNLGRNTLIGPALSVVDLSLTKRVRWSGLGDQGLVEFRGEFFNAFNTTNFDLPSQRRQAAFTVDGTPDDVGRITSARESREIQFGLKLQF